MMLEDVLTSRERATVLVVDDVTENVMVLNQILSDDYRVLFATGGIKALELARVQSPDLILLDVDMPDLTGHQVCAELKQDPATKDIPVIFVTAMTQVADEEHGLRLGAVDFLAKPVRPPLVRLRVRNHLELKRQRDLLYRLSTTDGLTGIANRRHFDEFLGQEWARSIRSGLPLSLTLADIDHFKAYNDTYGHAAGDQCLVAVAEVLKQAVRRATDLVARFGGEEFASVLACTGHADALTVAHKLRQEVSERRIAHARSTAGDHVTISVGVGTVCRPGRFRIGELVEVADQCLYEAKRRGRNDVIGQVLG